MAKGILLKMPCVQYRRPRHSNLATHCHFYKPLHLTNMVLLLLTLVFLPFAASVEPTYKSCDALGAVVGLDVHPCGHPHETCKFPRGHNITLKVNFVTGIEVTSATPVVYAYVGPIKLPGPFAKEVDSCSKFDSPCPLAAGAEHTYTTVIYIDPAYPPIRVVAEWQVHDQNDNPIFCLQVPLEVV